MLPLLPAAGLAASRALSAAAGAAARAAAAAPWPRAYFEREKRSDKKKGKRKREKNCVGSDCSPIIKKTKQKRGRGAFDAETPSLSPPPLSFLFLIRSLHAREEEPSSLLVVVTFSLDVRRRRRPAAGAPGRRRRQRRCSRRRPISNDASSGPAPWMRLRRVRRGRAGRRVERGGQLPRSALQKRQGCVPGRAR